MATTTNFGWETPDDTDLVKDGALAMRTLGNGIDTSFVDLKGGTTGQILSKTSNTDLDFTWTTASSTGGLTLITNQAFTTVSSYSLPANTFTTTYNNYEIILDVTAFSASNTFTARLRSGSTDLTSSQYLYQDLTATSTTVAASQTTTTSFQIGDPNSNTNYQMKMTLYKPKLAVKKWYMLENFQYTQAGVWKITKAAGRIDDSGTYDSMSFIPSTGTMTGRVYVYGYNI
jgi:hypothetical protein